MKTLKILAYRMLSTKLGSSLLKILSFGISVKNLPRNNNKKTMPFIVAITIDTESGYVDKNERRIWQRENPHAFIGFYRGIENWRNLFNKNNVKASFLVSTQCFDAKDNELSLVKRQLDYLLNEKHEIGMHVHPDSDFALQKILNKRFDYTSAKFYDYNTKREILSASKELLIKNTKLKNISSFRWGNWGLDSDSVKILEELNFDVDSSATPGIKGHINDGMHYDWSKANSHYPWLLSVRNYADTRTQDSKVLELPIATFSFFGLKLRADPVNLSLLNQAFDYYYKNVSREEKPFVFVVISHSPEATYEGGRKTKAVDTMEEFINHAKKFSDVKFMTLKDASSYFLTAKTK